MKENQVSTKRDDLLISAIIGGLCTLAGEIVTKIFLWCGVGKFALYELNSLIVTSDTPSFVMGFLVNFVIGSFVGTLFYLAFQRLGTRHIVIKSLMGSLMMWFLFEIAFTLMIEGIFIDIRPISDHLVHIAGTATFGLALGYFLKLFIFREPKAALSDKDTNEEKG